jgi:hypothetical protein
VLSSRVIPGARRGMKSGIYSDFVWPVIRGILCVSVIQFLFGFWGGGFVCVCVFVFPFRHLLP